MVFFREERGGELGEGRFKERGFKGGCFKGVLKGWRGGFKERERGGEGGGLLGVDMPDAGSQTESGLES